MLSSAQHRWPDLAMDSYLLTLEASWVMWLRWQKMIVGGPLAERESTRMVTEKMIAAAGLLPALAGAGALGSAEAMASGVLAHYGKTVRANRRRLSR